MGDRFIRGTAAEGANVTPEEIKGIKEQSVIQEQGDEVPKLVTAIVAKTALCPGGVVCLPLNRRGNQQFIAAPELGAFTKVA